MVESRHEAHCPNCGAEIAAGDMNLQTLVAKCGRCNNVFSFAGLVGGTETAPARALGRPSRMTVEEFGGTWSVRWRWFTPAYIFLTFFCVAWDSFLIFWYHIAFTSKNTPWLMIVFPVAHVAIGIGLTYSVLTGYLNRTIISISGGILGVRHGPLPWIGNRDLPVTRIDHFVTGWSAGSNNKYVQSNARNPSSYLAAVTADGETIRLVGGFTGDDEPRYLQQQLEWKLNLSPGVSPAH